MRNLSGLIGLIGMLLASFAIQFAVVETARAASCDYYAGPQVVYPNGSGTSADPFTIREFFELAPATLQGKTLCLADGEYRGNDNLIRPPTGLSGSATAPITVRAENDGEVLLDGRSAGPGTVADTEPVRLRDNQYFVLEGFNACCGRAGVVLIGSSSNSVWNSGSLGTIVRRVVAWDAKIDQQNVHTMAVSGSESVLLEDVAAFGTGRKNIQVYKSKNVTIRRSWSRWEGFNFPLSPGYPSPAISTSCSYRSCGNVCENVVATWSAEQQPPGVLQYNPVAPISIDPHGPRDGNPTGCDTTGQDDADLQILGSVAYVNDLPTMSQSANTVPFSGIELKGSDDIHVKDVVTYMSPTIELDTTKDPTALHLWRCAEEPPCTLNLAENITAISANNPVLHPEWTTSNLYTVTDPAQVATPQYNIFNGTDPAGGRVCKRYIDGSLTGEALWPWPMNDRIFDATLAARGVGTDVTAEVNAAFNGGAEAPIECRKPQCSDGLDNDGDGFVDWPADPTCPSATFDAEFVGGGC